MAEESGRPGTCRSKVGIDAIEEPCTNRILPAVLAGSPAHLFHRNRRTSWPLLVQCSSPRMGKGGITGLFIGLLLWARQDFGTRRIITYTVVASPAARRNTLHWLASTSTATSSPTFRCCNGCVCTRSTWPERSVA